MSIVVRMDSVAPSNTATAFGQHEWLACEASTYIPIAPEAGLLSPPQLGGFLYKPVGVYFSKCSNISLDNAIMEKTNKGVVIKLDAGWSDLGNWKALWENDKKDSNGNVIQGRVLSENVKNCYLRSESRIIACLDIEDLIIVENSDSVLVANKSSAQSVKEIVKELDYKGFIEGKSHKKVYRPWGNYTSIAEDERWQVKMIVVKPDASLSLQMHHHRSEHWIVVKGTALVEIDENQKLLSENESVYIPVGCKHRLSNPGKSDIVLIEVQSGAYLGEDDIVRFEDKYGRLK